MHDYLLAPLTGLNTPYTFIISIRSLQLTNLLSRGRTLFHFTLIMILEQKPCHWNNSKTISASLQRNYSKTISKLVLAEFLHLRNQPSSTRFARQMILLVLIQNCNNTWPNGYNDPLHVHIIHSLATIHLLNSTRRNSFRLPSQFVTSLTWIFPLSLLREQNPIFTINQQPPKEPELQPNFSTSMMVPVSLSFQLLVE